jgi:hypothetical protein
VAFPTADADPDNDAKPGCVVRLDFYGFKPGTYAAEFTAIEPTGGTLGVIAGGDVAVDGDRTPASRLQDSERFTLDVAGLVPTNAGYHVRVEVTRPDRDGNGAKTKAFAFACTPGNPVLFTGGGGGAAVGGTAAFAGTGAAAAGAGAAGAGVAAAGAPAAVRVPRGGFAAGGGGTAVAARDLTPAGLLLGGALLAAGAVRRRGALS